MTSDNVTLVTKVVAITSFLGSPEAPSTTNAPDQSDGNALITDVVRVGVTTANPADCQPLLCSINVAVSDSLSSSKLKQTLNMDSVGFRILLAPGVRKHSVSLHNLRSTISGASTWTDPVSLHASYLDNVSKYHTDRAPRQSPSIYGIFYSISLSNGCGSLSTTWDSITMSFTPGALSTVAPVGTTAEVFNFADLPCPPPGIYVEPGQLYQPQFAPPRVFFSSLQAANPAALQGCPDGVWADGWSDPPIAFVTSGPLEGPGQAGGGRPPRLRRELAANAHRFARTPTQTAGRS